MVQLFSRGYLHGYFSDRRQQAARSFESMPEDEVLRRTTDDLVTQLVQRTTLHPLEISHDPVDGDLEEVAVTVSDPFFGQNVQRRIFKASATYQLSGSTELLYYRPSTSRMASFDAEVRGELLTVHGEVSAEQATAEAVRASFGRELENIRANATYANRDIVGFNAELEGYFRTVVDRRKGVLQKRRDLAGALGFPLRKRTDSPAPVPLQRRSLGVQRAAVAHKPYRDEPALTDAQYEDAIGVISSALLSMERTPSAVDGKDEEELRDLLLIGLNGTFEGTATGETFVKQGKTDILIRVEDRHVFVGECKWWKGAKALAEAVDQLLSYLPWRDEKAALVVFINAKDASAVFDKTEAAIRGHAAFKRAGKRTDDATRRRNFVLGHPEDPEREIQVAVLFAVLTSVKSKQKDV